MIMKMAHEDSAMHRFMCGNLETLKKEGIRKNLLDFHEKYYSSNIMNLVVTGKHSIDQLEEWVKSKFSPVKNKDVVLPDYSQPRMPYDKDNLGRIVKWKPIKDKNSLELYFVLPYTQNEYTTRPLEYYSHLIGHEGENSLLSYLKKEDLATELSSNFSSELDVFSDFSVDIRLTDNGLKNYERVLEAVFKYNQRIAEIGPKKEVWEEVKKVGDLKFEF